MQQHENIDLRDMDYTSLNPQLYTNCTENMELAMPKQQPADEPMRISRTSLPILAIPAEPEVPNPPVRTSDAVMEDISRPPQLPVTMEGEWRASRPSNENRASMEKFSLGSSAAEERLRLSLSQAEAPPNPFEANPPPRAGILLYAEDMHPGPEEKKEPPAKTDKKLGVIETSKLKGCNCKKSKCLKLYCECLALQKYCTADCNCADCYNTVDHKEEREAAMERIMNKNPISLLRRVQNPVHDPIVGCNCKKSSCQQNYCYCYKNGISCGKLCKCTDCVNRKGPTSTSGPVSGPVPSQN